MTRRLTVPLALAAALALGACADSRTNPLAPDDAAAPTLGRNLPPAGARGFTVMTRNLYLGADLDPILRTTDPRLLPGVVAQTWAKVQATNYPERAGALAEEIAATSPHLVGLQEVVLYRVQQPGDAAFGGTTPATRVAYDFLATLLDSLAVRGLVYEPVAVQQLTDIELPAIVSVNPLGFIDVRYTDHDVILARAGVPTADAAGGVYDSLLTVRLGPATVPIRRGWTAATATVAGNTVRFVNTHLETQSGAAKQEAQARQLLGMLAGESLPVVLVGDFNSAADGSQTASYGMVVGSGFVDAWSEAHPRDPGFTCCHAELLRGTARVPDQRLDLIFVRDRFGHASAGIVGGVHADVLGEEPRDLTASGLWPSDHAGVVATLRIPPNVAQR